MNRDKNSDRKKLLSGEVMVSLALIILVILCTNPFDFFMPSSLVMMLAGIVLALFVIFAVLIWREDPKDEREAYHAKIAARFAYLTGATILVIGFLVQELFSLQNDPWIVFAFTGMILAKIVGQIYGKIKY